MQWDLRGRKKQQQPSKFILQPFVHKNVLVGDSYPQPPCVCSLEFISEPRKMGVWLCYSMGHEQAVGVLCALWLLLLCGQSLLLQFGLFPWAAGCTYRKRHFPWDWVKQTHSICCCCGFPTCHGDVTWLRLCFTMSLYCFHPLTLSTFNLPHSCHPSFMCVQMSGAVLWQELLLCQSAL